MKTKQTNQIAVIKPGFSTRGKMYAKVKNLGRKCMLNIYAHFQKLVVLKRQQKVTVSKKTVVKRIFNRSQIVVPDTNVLVYYCNRALKGDKGLKHHMKEWTKNGMLYIPNTVIKEFSVSKYADANERCNDLVAYVSNEESSKRNHHVMPDRVSGGISGTLPTINAWFAGIDGETTLGRKLRVLKARKTWKFFGKNDRKILAECALLAEGNYEKQVVFVTYDKDFTLLSEEILRKFNVRVLHLKNLLPKCNIQKKPHVIVQTKASKHAKDDRPLVPKCRTWKKPAAVAQTKIPKYAKDDRPLGRMMQNQAKANFVTAKKQFYKAAGEFVKAQAGNKYFKNPLADATFKLALKQHSFAARKLAKARNEQLQWFKNPFENQYKLARNLLGTVTRELNDSITQHKMCPNKQSLAELKLTKKRYRLVHTKNFKVEKQFQKANFQWCA